MSALMEAHQRAKNKFCAKRDREKLVEEITQKVIERLSITADVTQAVQDIEELKKALESVVSILKKGGR